MSEPDVYTVHKSYLTAHRNGEPIGTHDLVVVMADDLSRANSKLDAALAREAQLIKDKYDDENTFNREIEKREKREAALREELAALKVAAANVIVEGDALQQRLTAAEKRAHDLEGALSARESELEEFSTEMTLAITDSQIRSSMTVIGRSRFLQLLQAYNARIEAALNPAEGEGL